MCTASTYKFILILIQAGGFCKWVNDSQHLLMGYFEVIRDSPSHIYHSALPFSPSSSWLHDCYSTMLSQEVRVVKGLPVEWGECFRTVTLDTYPWVITCWKNIIAAGHHDGSITVLDGVTGSQTAVLSGHTNAVKSLTSSSDGTSLVSGSGDKTVKLWDTQTGGVVKTFHGHTGWVISVSISVDSTMIASGSEDNTIHLWVIQTEECCQIINQQEPVHYTRFPLINPQCLVSTSGDKLWQWDINGHQINPKQDGFHTTLSLDQIQLVVCQGVAAVVEHFDKRQLGNCCCFLSDSLLVAVAAGSVINIWDITSSDPYLVKTLVGHSSEISSLTFSPPSSLISSAYDRSIKFWHVDTLLMGPIMSDPKATPLSSASIRSITLQAKSGIAITSDSDGVVRIWDLSTGISKASIQTPANDHTVGAGQLINEKLAFAWHVQETYLLVAQKVYVWDAEKGTAQTICVGWGIINDLKISEDGSRVFCLQEGYIQVWYILTGKALGKVDLMYSLAQTSLSVDGSRVWVHFPNSEPQGWDFGVPGSSPAKQSKIMPIHHNYTKLWDVGQSRIKDAVTGKVIFQLGERFANPVTSQWDGWYLAAGYKSGEVLILDFNHVLP